MMVGTENVGLCRRSVSKVAEVVDVNDGGGNSRDDDQGRTVTAVYPEAVLLAKSTPVDSVTGVGTVLDDLGMVTVDRPEVAGGDLVAEFGGRLCYNSFARPNPGTFDTKDYVANIIAQEHTSVLEHSTVTFLLTGVSRSVTHELVRHRHFSYSQVSQRYVDVSKNMEFIIPPAHRDYPELVDMDYQAVFTALDAYEREVEIQSEKFREAGMTKYRKLAREAARGVLPNMTATAIVVTANMTGLRHFFARRLHPAADAEMREAALEILRAVYPASPACLQGFEEYLEVGLAAEPVTGV